MDASILVSVTSSSDTHLLRLTEQKGLKYCPWTQGSLSLLGHALMHKFVSTIAITPQIRTKLQKAMARLWEDISLEKEGLGLKGMHSFYTMRML